MYLCKTKMMKKMHINTKVKISNICLSTMYLTTVSILFCKVSDTILFIIFFIIQSCYIYHCDVCIYWFILCLTNPSLCFGETYFYFDNFWESWSSIRSSYLGGRLPTVEGICSPWSTDTRGPPALYHYVDHPRQSPWSKAF